MASILFGNETGPELFKLNARLRHATLEEYNTMGSDKESYYSPWLCLAPLYHSQTIPRSLLRQPALERGQLVTDREYLAAAREFMQPRLGFTQNGIFNQEHIDWIPITEIAPWQEKLFDEGRTILLRSTPNFTRMYFELVDFVLPLSGSRNRGFSSHLARGIIFRAIPEDADKYDIAIDLAHELGHHGLMVLQSIDQIISSDPMRPVYSQIRRTLRPAIQTFHAAAALAFMLMLVKAMPNDDACQLAGERRGQKYTNSLDRSLQLSIDTLRLNCNFTPLGELLMAEMESV